MIRTQAKFETPFVVIGYLLLLSLLTVMILSIKFHLFSGSWVFLAIVIFLVLILLFHLIKEGIKSDCYGTRHLKVGEYFIASYHGELFGGSSQPTRYCGNLYYCRNCVNTYIFPTGSIVVSFSRSVNLTGLPKEVNFSLSFLVEHPSLVIKNGLSYTSAKVIVEASDHTLEKRVLELFKVVHNHVSDEIVDKTCLSVSKGDTAERDKLLGELKQSMQKQFDLNNLGCKVDSVTMSL